MNLHVVSEGTQRTAHENALLHSIQVIYSANGNRSMDAAEIPILGAGTNATRQRTFKSSQAICGGSLSVAAPAITPQKYRLLTFDDNASADRHTSSASLLITDYFPVKNAISLAQALRYLRAIRLDAILVDAEARPTAGSDDVSALDCITPTLPIVVLAAAAG